MLGWDAKNNPRKTGLHEILGRDYGIEEHFIMGDPLDMPLNSS